MPEYLLGLGSSEINGSSIIRQAIEILSSSPHLTIHGASRIFKNKGKSTSLNLIFHNASIAISTFLNPQSLLNHTKALEHKFGRIRPFKNAPRTLDIDLLLAFHMRYKSKNLDIPHKALLERKFFITPSLEALDLARWPKPIALQMASIKLYEEMLLPLNKGLKNDK